MFTSAARTMGYDVIVLDPDPASPAAHFATEHLCADFHDQRALESLVRRCAAVTTEFENPPADSLAWLAERIPVRPGASAVAIAQDRIREKSFFADNGFPVGPFAIIRSGTDIEAADRSIKFPAILKTARFGYDGKGQARVTSEQAARESFHSWSAVPCVLEQLLPLKLEVSVILARGKDGAIATFPVAENRHENGILDISIAPARISARLTAQAQEIAERLAAKLDYCGVLAVEFFVVDGKDGQEQLLINEIAPRPHNSGHYTIDACPTSQFEQQVRALCGLPLGAMTQHTPAVMVNLLGDAWKNNVLAADKILQEPNAKLHLYGKREARDGRKMGHYTVLGDDIESALALALKIKRRLI
ncbi:MAG: 5-(carboxyamino)imidazole ribonucleotide synthase [Pseudomonadota bacterium]|nr:5-(carboxyamino)imidazole ribonucleotide synthase [Pseudomonadota bacterium]